jgi:hypothetical protein
VFSCCRVKREASPSLARQASIKTATRLRRHFFPTLLLIGGPIQISAPRRKGSQTVMNEKRPAAGNPTAGRFCFSKRLV